VSVLIVVSHPDDEVLGCGGAAAALADAGMEVHSCILSKDVHVRRHRPDEPELADDIRAAQCLLGLGEPVLGTFPNIEFNTVPHIQLVQFIEGAIEKTRATVVFTHHPHDLNNDHRHTSLACQAAVRLFQRKANIAPLRAFYFMEILSSTDWAFACRGDEFRPDTYFELGEEALERKIKALQAYEGVMREFPHPRSHEILRGLAAYRGGQAGMRYAEAFQTVFHALKPGDFR
jgi:LmbE family N-acetylglucosaminyl deacetylase